MKFHYNLIKKPNNSNYDRNRSKSTRKKKNFQKNTILYWGISEIIISTVHGRTLSSHSVYACGSIK